MQTLIADPESSGRYVLRPELLTHRDEAYYKVLRYFDLKEKDFPMNLLITNAEARVHFASVTVAQFVRAGVINPKKWLPQQTSVRAMRMELEALNCIGRTLNLKTTTTTKKNMFDNNLETDLWSEQTFTTHSHTIGY